MILEMFIVVTCLNLNAGDSYLKHGQYELAKDGYQRYLKDKKDPDIVLNLSKCNFLLQEYEQAAKELKPVVQLLSTPQKRGEGFFLLGLCEYNLENYTLALEYFSLAKNFPISGVKRENLWYMIAKSLYNQGNYADAVEYFTRVKDNLKEMNPELNYRLGLALLKENRLKEAESILRESSSDNLWGAKSTYFLARIYHLKGELDSTSLILKRIPKTYSDPVASMWSYFCLAEMERMNKNYDKAMEYFYKVRGYTTDEWIAEESLFRIGLCAFLNQKWRDARDAFLILTEDSGSVFYQSGLFFAAESEYKRGMYKTSQRLYEKALETPFKMHSLYGLGYSYYRQGIFKKSISKFKEFLELYRDSPLADDARYRIAKAYFSMNRCDEAVKYLSTLKDEDSYYLLSRCYIKLSLYDDALSELDKLQKEYPQGRLYDRAQKLMGDVYFEKGWYRTAIKSYRKLEGIASVSLLDEARYQIERCYYKLGIYKSPLTISRHYISNYPKSPKSAILQLELADYFYETKQYQRAIKEYKKFLNDFLWSDKFVDAHFGLARSYYQIGAYYRAIEEYLKITEYDHPMAPKAYFEAANVYFVRKDYDSAIAGFQDLIEKFKETDYAEESQYMIGICYMELHLYEEARISFERLISEYPDSPFVEEAQFKIASAFYEQGMFDEALDKLEEISESSKGRTRADAYFMTAGIHLEKGEYELATDAYLKSANFCKGDLKAMALVMAARSLEKLDSHQEAISIYEKAKNFATDQKTKENIEAEIRRLKELDEKD